MAVLQGLIGVSYPILIFLALTWLEPRQTAILVLILTALRFAIARPSLAASTMAMKEVWLLVALVAGVVSVTAYLNDPIGLLLAPVLVNLVFLGTFGLSLRSEQPMVERFARLQVEDLPDEEVRYCRTVTKVWCAFFVANGTICLVLAWARNLEIWALYTGFVSYLLIGTLFGIEYVYRHYRFRRYLGGFADPLLKRFFPPPPLSPPPPPLSPPPPSPPVSRAADLGAEEDPRERTV